MTVQPFDASRPPSGPGRWTSRVSFRNRLILLFVFMMSLTLAASVTVSFLETKATLTKTVENRLRREMDVMSSIVRNLHFVYVSDEAYFRQQVEVTVHEQKRQLNGDGLEAVHGMDLMTKQTVAQVEQIIDSVKDRLTTAHRAKQALDAVMGLIAAVHEQIAGMQGDLQSLKEQIPAVERVLLDFSTVSQETFASSEHMLAISQDQTSHMSRTHDVGEELTHLSGTLVKLARTFETK